MKTPYKIPTQTRIGNVHLKVWVDKFLCDRNKWIKQSWDAYFSTSFTNNFISFYTLCIFWMLQEQTEYKAINLDQWTSFLRFGSEVNTFQMNLRCCCWSWKNRVIFEIPFSFLESLSMIGDWHICCAGQGRYEQLRREHGLARFVRQLCRVV